MVILAIDKANVHSRILQSAHHIYPTKPATNHDHVLVAGADVLVVLQIAVQ